MSKKKNFSADYSRRDFIRKVALGSGAVFFFGYAGIPNPVEGKTPVKNEYSMIVVDYDKCTGCRTCETVCASYNHKQMVNSELLPGLGNPHLSNVKVPHFNPDADIPIVCSMCPDNPCIGACPVDPDGKTGNRALYRDRSIGVIKVDAGRCIGCGRCADACRRERAGIIIPDTETGRPERMCTLCGNDPQCVKYCPYGAMSEVRVDPKMRFYGMAPEKIASQLTERWYGGK